MVENVLCCMSVLQKPLEISLTILFSLKQLTYRNVKIIKVQKLVTCFAQVFFSMFSYNTYTTDIDIHKTNLLTVQRTVETKYRICISTLLTFMHRTQGICLKLSMKTFFFKYVTSLIMLHGFLKIFLTFNFLVYLVSKVLANFKLTM